MIVYLKPLVNALLVALVFGAMVAAMHLFDGAAAAREAEQLAAAYRAALRAGATWALGLFVPLAAVVVVRVALVRRRLARAARPGAPRQP